MAICADCGFLAVRNRRTRELAEAEHDVREWGEMPVISARGADFEEAYDGHVICAQGVRDFSADELRMFPATLGGSRKDALAVALDEEIECTMFGKWGCRTQPEGAPRDVRPAVDDRSR